MLKNNNRIVALFLKITNKYIKLDLLIIGLLEVMLHQKPLLINKTMYLRLPILPNLHQ
jgi:hypothetical protein